MKRFPLKNRTVINPVNLKHGSKFASIHQKEILSVSSHTQTYICQLNVFSFFIILLISVFNCFYLSHFIHLAGLLLMEYDIDLDSDKEQKRLAHFEPEKGRRSFTLTDSQTCTNQIYLKYLVG